MQHMVHKAERCADIRPSLFRRKSQRLADDAQQVPTPLFCRDKYLHFFAEKQQPDFVPVAQR